MACLGLLVRLRAGYEFTDVKGFGRVLPLCMFFFAISSVIMYGPDVGAANVPPKLCSLGSEMFTSTKFPTRNVWNFRCKSYLCFCCSFISVSAVCATFQLYES